jgi:hypothetical protein
VELKLEEKKYELAKNLSRVQYLVPVCMSGSGCSGYPGGGCEKSPWPEKEGEIEKSKDKNRNRKGQNRIKSRKSRKSTNQI